MKPTSLRRAFWAPIGIGVALTTIYLSVLWFNSSETKKLETEVTATEEDIPSVPETPPKQETQGEEGKQEEKATEPEQKEEGKDQEQGKQPKGDEKQEESSKTTEAKEETTEGKTEESPKPETSVKNTDDDSQQENATITASLGNLPLEEYIRKQVSEIISYEHEWIKNREVLINAWRINTKITSLIQALEEYAKKPKTSS